jgi:hypothetical protein
MNACPLKPSTLTPSLVIALLTLRACCAGQELARHSSERFDTVGIPLLPAGWSTSSERIPAGDFVTTGSGAASAPGCAVSSNATVGQSLTTPPLDFAGWNGCVADWNERRSASHDASLSLEASTDGGTTFLPATPAPLLPAGVTSYVPRSVPLPPWTDGVRNVLLRWTVAGDGSGSTGTIRLDDIVVRGRPAWDLSLGLDATDPLRPLPGEDVHCSGRVVNTGTGAPPRAVVTWAVDADGDGVPAPVEFGEPLNIGPPMPADTATFGFSFRRPDPGALTLFAIIVSDSDMVPSNDTATLALPAATTPGSAVITEIMYDPLQDAPEYVEIQNRSGGPIDVSGWRLVDEEDDSTGGVLGDAVTAPADDRGGTLILGAAEYLVCSPDTALRAAYPRIPPDAPVAEGVRGISLNNGGDQILLLDESLGIIDRVAYDPSWHTPAIESTQGRSLERIDPGSGGGEGWNWGTSAGVAGGTPGGPNSIGVTARSTGGELECNPNPFSPDGDGFEDVTLISFRAPGGPSVVRARIYDAQGTLVRTLEAGGYSGSGGAFAWNGYDDRGRKAPIGMYVIVVDAVNGDITDSTSLRAVVVVAGRL